MLFSKIHGSCGISGKNYAEIQHMDCKTQNLQIKFKLFKRFYCFHFNYSMSSKLLLNCNKQKLNMQDEHFLNLCTIKPNFYNIIFCVENKNIIKNRWRPNIGLGFED